MKVWSWHCTHDYFVETSRMKPAEKVILAPMQMNYTHYRMPICMEFIPTKLITEPEEALAQAFDYFNWAWNEFEAPGNVNDTARLYNTHSSQSVGDIVEIEGEGYWMVMSSGWKRLSDDDLHSLTEAVA